MKVDGARPTEASGQARRPGRSAAGQALFSLDAGQQAAVAGPVSAPVSLGTLDSLLALQAMPDAMTGRQRAVKRGQNLLALLDEMRDGLLSGMLNPALAGRLSAALQVQADGFVEPGLKSVIDDIDLRAQVELAKLQAAGRVRDSQLRA